MIGQLLCQKDYSSSCQLTPGHMDPEYPGCSQSLIVFFGQSVLPLRTRVSKCIEPRVAEKRMQMIQAGHW